MLTLSTTTGRLKSLAAAGCFVLAVCVGCAKQDLGNSESHGGRSDAVAPRVVDRTKNRSPSKNAETQSSQPGTVVAADPNVVPQGTTQELCQYIDGLNHLRPQGETPEEQRADSQRIQRGILTAADRLLETKTDERVRLYAARNKLDSLQILAQTGDAAARDKLNPFVEQLLKDANKELVVAAWQSKIASRLDAVYRGDQAEVDATVADVRSLLDLGAPNPDALMFTSQVGQMVEMSDQPAAARQIYESIAEAFAQSTDPELTKMAKEKTETPLRRLGLLGKPLVIAGKKLDGTPVDWEAYKGKVVLVDFWATWCPPCRAELPNVKEKYAAYHDRGFEVLGVSLDDPDTSKQVAEFLEKEKIPWPSLLSDDPKAGGYDDPVAKQIGVDFIPLPVLVAQDGNVVSLAARGDKLAKHLEKLLGPADKNAPDAKKTGLRWSRRGELIGAVVLLDQGDANQSDISLFKADKDLSPQQLLDYIDTMREKPETIRRRLGFAEAVVEASERILTGPGDERQKTQALLAKSEWLHFMSMQDNPDADKKLLQLAADMRDDKREAVAHEAAFVLLEKRVRDADSLKTEELPKLLADIEAFVSKETLTSRHLRLASGTVRIINQLKDDDAAYAAYKRVGETLSKSADRDVSRYGKKIATAAKPVSLVGKPIEIEGLTVDGKKLDWASYRGKVVLIDFWATWCGPCMAAMPDLLQTYDNYHGRGFEVVGVSLDTDHDALKKCIEDNKIGWTNLVGDGDADGWKHPLAVKFGIQAIPSAILVGKDGKVIAEGVRAEDLEKRLEKLLAADAAKSDNAKSGGDKSDADKSGDGKSGADKSSDTPPDKKSAGGQSTR